MGNVSGYNEVSLIAQADGFFYYVEDVAGVKTPRKVSPERLAGFFEFPICEGRLTLESGVPVSVADQTAKTSVFFTPHRGNRVGLYDGTRWHVRPFTQLTGALGTLVADKLYDWFIWDNAGVPTLELGPVWTGSGQAITGATNATPIVITANAHGLANGDEVYISGVGGNTAANGTWIVANQTTNTFELTGSVGNGAYTSGGYFSARAASGRLVLQDGIPVRTAQATRRHLGTMRTTATTTTEDSLVKRFLWNRYNQALRRMVVPVVSDSHAYATGTYREWNNGTNSTRLQLVTGEALTDGQMGHLGQINGVGFRGQGLDRVTFPYDGSGAGVVTAGVNSSPQATFPFDVAAGYHFIAVVEFGGASVTFVNYAQWATFRN
jgi:hypothetical protein